VLNIQPQGGVTIVIPGKFILRIAAIFLLSSCDEEEEEEEEE
jgi:hypothetical protein